MEEPMAKIISLLKRRGFVWQSAEEYGGGPATYDYGPLGVELKNNLKRAWWKEMVQLRENVVGLDSAILTNPKVWEASGHLEHFVDRLVECKQCHQRFAQDKIGDKCPVCGGELTAPKLFNTMFKTFVGSTEETAREIYLRPETCQSIFVDSQRVAQAMRLKIPYGIAQIGKSFRNEITTGNFIFRTREFEQMEMEFFVNPDEADKWFDYWKQERLNWYIKLGIDKKKLRWHVHQPDELAHYAKKAVDIEYEFPFGWQEIEGIHHRGNWDLTRHQQYSGHDYQYFNEETKTKFTPNVIETSGGLDRIFFALLCHAYHEISGGRTKTTEATKNQEIVLQLPKALTPVKVAVLPLAKKENIIELAKQVFHSLSPYYNCQYDASGSIGRRYRRQDEIGTPYCLTVDFDSLQDQSITIRDRDTMKQQRILIKQIIPYLQDKLNNERD